MLERLRHPHFRSVIIQLALPFLVVLLAICCFHYGVDLTDRGLVDDTDLFMQFYYALGLFALGGMDLGMPIGPSPWREILYVLYLVAPALSALALLKGMAALLPEASMLIPTSNHIVIVGGGRVAEACIQILSRTIKKNKILLVDINEPRQLCKHHARCLKGDVLNPDIQDLLCMERANACLVLTNDEMTNIEVGLLDKLEQNNVQTLVRITGGHMYEIFKNEQREYLRFFNFHQDISQIKTKSLVEKMKKTHDLDVLIIGGFGRYGRMVLMEFLKQEDWYRLIKGVVLIDRSMQQCMNEFLLTMPEELRDRIPSNRLELTGTLKELHIWEKAHSWINEQKLPAQNLFITLGSSQFQDNIEAATFLRTAFFPKGTISVRVQESNNFTRSLQKRYNLELVDASEILIKVLLKQLLHMKLLSAQDLAALKDEGFVNADVLEHGKDAEQDLSESA